MIKVLSWNISWSPWKVEALAVAAGAIVPGKQPNGKLPPRTPGDEEKIARRLGQARSTKENGKTAQNKTIFDNFNKLSLLFGFPLWY